MKATELPQGIFQSATFQLSQALGEAGGPAFERLNNDTAFRDKVAGYMIRGAPEQSSGAVLTERIAQAIMGVEKIIGPHKVQRRFGVPFCENLLGDSEVVPYLPETLARCKNSYLLVFGIPAVVGQIFETGQGRNRIGFNCRADGFREVAGTPVMVNSTPQPGWFLISREPVGARDGERTATVVEAYYALCLHKDDNPKRYFLQSANGICHETAEGGEVYFGLGSSFGARFSSDGSHDYWVRKLKPAHRALSINVVLPDGPTS